MKKLKKLVDLAFAQSLELIGKHLEINLCEMTLMVQFYGKKLFLTACKNDVPKARLNTEALVTPRMIGIRFGKEDLENMFRCLQYAFYKTQHVDPDRISLILYDSKKAQKPCVGVFVDSTPVKVMRISDVLEVLDTGKEQLN